MSGKKYVPEGVYLVCDKGTKPSELRSLSSKKTTIFGENMCTQIDTKLVVNFDPFGACSCANGNPCTAPVTGWTNVTDAITLGGNKLLLENSELPCALGGKVKIFFTMAAAMAAMPKPKKSFWRRYADTVVDISDWVLRAEKGLAIGVWKALKGTVTGIVDLVVWAGKHTHTYQMLNPKGYAEQIQKDVETFKALGNVAKKAGTWLYRNSDINKAINPQDYILAQQENAEMLDKMIEKASKMKVEEVTEFIGQVGFEIVLDVATVGGAAALTAVKVADKTLDVVKVVNAVDNTTDAVKVLDKTEDLADGAKALDKLNDGNKIELPRIEPKVLEDVKYLDEVPPVISKKKKKTKLKANTPEHKAQRWKDYQNKKPDSKMTYDEWSNRYNANMKNPLKGNASADAYHKKIGWGKREVPMRNKDGKIVRKLDIADVKKKKAVEVKDYSNSNVSYSKEIKKELNFDKTLVEDKWDVEWVFKGKGPSKPLEKALKGPPPVKWKMI